MRLTCTAQACRHVQAAPRHPVCAGAHTPPRSPCSLAAARYCTVFEAAGQLLHAPDAALAEMLAFYSVAGRVATLLQKARIVAVCRPLDPDIPALVGETLALHGLLDSPLQATAALLLPCVLAAETKPTT